MEITVRCHICNIDVAKLFITRHQHTELHRLNLELVNEAVDRLKKHLNESNFSTWIKIKQKKKFCDVCNCTYKEDNTPHELSVKHLSSSSYIQELRYFAKFYFTPPIDFNKIQFDNPEYKKIQKYINDLSDKYSIKHLKAFDEDNLEIIAVNGKRVKVGFDKFHTLSGDVYVHCQLCHKVLSGNLKMEHINSDEHLEKIKNPFPDENCISQRDRMGFCYCLLCSKYISYADVYQHITSDQKHKVTVKTALISEKKYDLSSLCDNLNITDNKTVAKYENGHSINDLISPKKPIIDIKLPQPSTTSSTLTSSKVMIHQNNPELDYEIPAAILKATKKRKTKSKSKNKTNQTTVNTTPTQDSGLTDEGITDNEQETQSHVHAYNKVLVSQNCVELETGISLANVSEIPTVQNIVKDVVANIDGHFQKSDNESAKSSCEIVDKDITMFICDNDQHKSEDAKQKNNNHNLNLATKLINIQSTEEDNHGDYSANTFMQSGINDKMLLCRVCLVAVLKNVNIMNEHLNGNKHQKKYKTMLLINKLVLENNNVLCQACEHCICLDDMFDHINSETHIHRIHPDQLFAGKEDVHDEGTMCTISDTDVSGVSVHEHENGRQHEIMIKEIAAANVLRALCHSINSFDELEYDEIEISNQHTELENYIHLITREYPAEHKINVLNHIYLEITAMNGDKIIISKDQFHSFNVSATMAGCYLCGLVINGQENIKLHINSKIHKRNAMINFEDRHCIRKREDVKFSFPHYCLLCQSSLYELSIDIHKQSTEHLQKVDNVVFSTIAEKISTDSSIWYEESLKLVCHPKNPIAKPSTSKQVSQGVVKKPVVKIGKPPVEEQLIVDEWLAGKEKISTIAEKNLTDTSIQHEELVKPVCHPKNPITKPSTSKQVSQGVVKKPVVKLGKNPVEEQLIVDEWLAGKEKISTIAEKNSTDTSIQHEELVKPVCHPKNPITKPSTSKQVSQGVVKKPVVKLGKPPVEEQLIVDEWLAGKEKISTIAEKNSTDTSIQLEELMKPVCHPKRPITKPSSSKQVSQGVVKKPVVKLGKPPVEEQLIVDEWLAGKEKVGITETHTNGGKSYAKVASESKIAVVASDQVAAENSEVTSAYSKVALNNPKVDAINNKVTPADKITAAENNNVTAVNNKVKMSAFEKEEQLNYQLAPTEDSKEVLCRICSAIVPKTESNIHGHLIGRRHLKERKKFLAENNIATIATTNYGVSFVCFKCKHLLSETSLFNHIGLHKSTP